MKAIIEVDVPDYQIGQEASIYFKDTMMIKGIVQEPKTGHWIDDNENEIDAQYSRHLYKCAECNEYANAFVGGTEDWWDLEKPNYCPNCGRRMVEPQESEDEE